MDSMRTLNRTLPRVRRRRRSQDSSHEVLLQTFKNAALSVTKLYRNAATSQIEARQEGYQDAIQDLVGFLDQQNLGLGDGEGWRVRQWALEKYDETGDGSIESDGDTSDQRSPSPAKDPPPQTRSSPARPASSSPLSNLFTFRAPPSSDTAESAANAGIRVAVVPRNRPNRKQSNRTSTSRSLGIGAGNKRRIPYGDFFDLGDGFASHKRHQRT